jgi:hypothetical protein
MNGVWNNIYVCSKRWRKGDSPLATRECNNCEMIGYGK